MSSKNEKEALRNPVEITTYEARMSTFMIGIIYQTMIHRACKRYSPKGLSFLAGKDLLFVEKIEQMKLPNITLTDMSIIGKVVGAASVAYFFQEHEPSDLEKHVYRLTQTVYKDKILYQMEQLLKSGKADPLFIVWDKNHDTDYYPDATKEEQESLRIAVQALIELNYFHEQRSSIDIFRTCQSLVWEYMNPMNLYHVLTAFTRQKRYPKLKRVKSKYSVFNYVAVKKPTK